MTEATIKKRHSVIDTNEDIDKILKEFNLDIKDLINLSQNRKNDEIKLKTIFPKDKKIKKNSSLSNINFEDANNNSLNLKQIKKLKILNKDNKEIDYYSGKYHRTQTKKGTLNKNKFVIDIAGHINIWIDTTNQIVGQCRIECFDEKGNKLGTTENIFEIIDNQKPILPEDDIKHKEPKITKVIGPEEIQKGKILEIIIEGENLEGLKQDVYLLRKEKDNTYAISGKLDNLKVKFIINQIWDKKQRKWIDILKEQKLKLHFKTTENKWIQPDKEFFVTIKVDNPKVITSTKKVLLKDEVEIKVIGLNGEKGILYFEEGEIDTKEHFITHKGEVDITSPINADIDYTISVMLKESKQKLSIKSAKLMVGDKEENTQILDGKLKVKFIYSLDNTSKQNKNILTITLDENNTELKKSKLKQELDDKLKDKWQDYIKKTLNETRLFKKEKVSDDLTVLISSSEFVKDIDDMINFAHKFGANNMNKKLKDLKKIHERYTKGELK